MRNVSDRSSRQNEDTHFISLVSNQLGRSQWPRGLRRRSAAARRLRSWVRTPPGAWMFFCCKCCVLSGSGLCNELITHPEESCPLWCVVVCDLETSRMRRPWPALDRSATGKNKYIYIERETERERERESHLRRRGGPQCRSGCFVKRMNSLSHAETRTAIPRTPIP